MACEDGCTGQGTCQLDGAGVSGCRQMPPPTLPLRLTLTLNPINLSPNPLPRNLPSCDDSWVGNDCSDRKLPVPTISSNLQLGMHDSLIAVNEANLLASPTSSGSPLKESALLAEQVATTHTGSCAPSYRRAYSHFCPHVHYCTSARCILPFLLHDFRSSSTPHSAPELSQYAETGPKRVAVLEGRG